MGSRIGPYPDRGVGTDRAHPTNGYAVGGSGHPRKQASPRAVMVPIGRHIYFRVVQRNVMFRILASVLSVWLVVCLAEPAQLHTCVMHGGLAINASHATHHAATHSAHTTAATVAKHSQPQKDGGHATQCTCLGDCSTGGTVVAVTASPISLASNTVEVPAAPFAYASPAIVAPQFLRPFSNGPPPASSRA